MYLPENKLRLQEYFFLHPTARLRVREIERRADLPLPSVTRYVEELTEEGILQRVRIGDATFFTTDRASTVYLRRKLLFNLESLWESGLIDHLVKVLDNAPIRLFGSYARAEDTEDSDIDLYIQTPERVPDLSRFERKLHRSIQVHSAGSITALTNPHLADNIMNGIPLHGHIEVRSEGS